MAKIDPRITKRRVTMRNARLGPEGQVLTEERTDYVRPDFLEAFVAYASTRWQQVEVSEEPDAGPGGFHGATHIPAVLDHPLAGATFAATQED